MRHLKRIVVLLVTLIFAVCALAVPAMADSIEETAVTVNSGDTIQDNFITQNEGWWYDKYLDYKIVVSDKGTINIEFSAGVPQVILSIYDSNGEEVINKDYKVISGTAQLSEKSICYKWNETTEKIKGSASFEVSKGTYYIRLNSPWYNYNDGNRKVETKITYSKSATSATISYLTLNLKNGSSIKLGAVLSGGKGTVTWKSSKKSVATVSSKGTVTAKKKGSTIISATCGGKTVKIKIIVT